MAGFFNKARDIDASHSHFTTISGDQHTTIHVYSAHQESVLSSLNPVDRTGYYLPPCIPGTRRWIFESIQTWLNNPLTPNILWLSGSPGAGKSTIASTLVSSLEEQGTLGSHFACKRGDLVLSDPAVIWRTVASDLARYDSAFAERLIKNLEARKSNPGRADIESHFKHFIKDPLTESRKRHLEAMGAQGSAGEEDKERFRENSSMPFLVVVLDALDECGSDGSQSAQRRIFMNTVTDWSHLHPSFKLLVTSRDHRITPSFRAVCHHVALETGDLVTSEGKSDIKLFFERRFAEIADLYPSLPPSWPGTRVLKQLTDRAAGLFIWADTVIRFLEQGFPKQQLDLVLSGTFREDGDVIDVLYRQILQLSFPNPKSGVLETFKRVVGAIVLAQVPLFRGDLRHFLGLQEDEASIDYILHNLSSVIRRHADGRLHVSHLSFAEFICDSKRCDKAFVIDRGIHNGIIALACLQIMKAELRFNICQLETSHLRNDAVSDLASRVSKAIPTYLSYSCCFFADHLAAVEVGLLEEIKDFMESRLLYWLEVLSLIKKVGIASRVLLLICEWGKVGFIVLVINCEEFYTYLL